MKKQEGGRAVYARPFACIHNCITVTLEPPAHRQQISRAVLVLARKARASASL
jgi:hypothetical protein